MMFLVIIGTLAIGMYAMATMGTESADNMRHSDRAQASAESGMRFIINRLRTMNRPFSDKGAILPPEADRLFDLIATELQTQYNGLSNRTGATFVRGNSAAGYTVGYVENGTNKTFTDTPGFLWFGPLSIGTGDQRFSVRIEQYPTADNLAQDQRSLRVTVWGFSGCGAVVARTPTSTTDVPLQGLHTIVMDFDIEKKVRYAVISKTRVQIGRNTVIEGPVGTTSDRSNPREPLLLLSDFKHLATALRNRVNNYEDYLSANYNGFDNRVSKLTHPSLYNAAQLAGYTDYDANGVIEDFDFFLQQYDANGDRRVATSEFTNSSTGFSVDGNLFRTFDELGATLVDGSGTSITQRPGYRDGFIDALDGYAKVRGSMYTTTSQSAWQSDVASRGQTLVGDMISGPVSRENPLDTPVRFGASTSDMFDLSPANFEACAAGFRNRSGTNAGTATQSAVLIQNQTLPLALANGTPVIERSPFGSVSYQVTLRRPVFRNMTLRNIIIPRGMNPLFENCVFEGVTFIDSERNITQSNGTTVTTSSGDGMSWANRRIAGNSTINRDTVLLGTGNTPTTPQATTQGSVNGNNVRFNNCTFKGPIANNYSTAYTHWANSWEFTGSTLFDNQVDATATIVAPQTNIEMGSFTNPFASPSTLNGVVVAGNIDIRGTSVVDGSIIVTGDGAGNTTLGYFGPSDGDTNPTAMPEGGYGRLNIRYNPYRALPDGINIAVVITPVFDSYKELR